MRHAEYYTISPERLTAVPPLANRRNESDYGVLRGCIGSRRTNCCSSRTCSADSHARPSPRRRYVRMPRRRSSL